MNTINFLQVQDEGHCLTCHKDFKKSEGEHLCFLNSNSTPCTKSCGKGWEETNKLINKMKITDEKVVEEEWEKDILSKYFVYRLTGDKSHVGAQNDLIMDIKQLLQKQREELVKRAQEIVATEMDNLSVKTTNAEFIACDDLAINIINKLKLIK